MKGRRDISTPCVVRVNNNECAGKTGTVGDLTAELEACTIIEPVKKLMALGASSPNFGGFDIRQPLLQAICEYARMECGNDEVDQASSELNATIKVIEDQLRSLDLEAEMLKMRKRALKRRKQILERLAGSLDSDDDPTAD